MIFDLINPPPGAVELIEDAYSHIEYPWEVVEAALLARGKTTVPVQFQPLTDNYLGLYGRGSGTIFITTTQGLNHYPFTFAHEVGHMVDHLVLVEEQRNQIIEEMLARIDNLHQWTPHAETWRAPTNPYSLRINEAWADLFVAAYAPVLWGSKGPYSRFQHWITDYPLVHRLTEPKEPEPDMPPESIIGRGAFKATGKDNGSRWYEYIDGTPLDGSSPERDLNYEAVHLGVLAIQKRVNAFRLVPPVPTTGQFGALTREAVMAFQAHVGLRSDGQVGPATCQALWRDLLIWFGGVYHVPASQMYGFMMLESGGDPGAVGMVTPDRGLNQINLVAHPDISVEQAFDPVFSIDYTAKRLGAARIQFSGKTSDLKNRCAIAQHNNPLAARQWYETGSPPNEKIAQYVDLVLDHALRFSA